jgi:putative aldouronate transport system permease protein
VSFVKKEGYIGRGIFNVLNIGMFILFAFICIFPFYYIFINTISDNTLVVSGKILFIPEGIHINNYLQVFKIRGLFSAALISVCRTVLGTLFTLIGSSFLGYALGRKEYWKRKFWYRFIIISMYFNAGIIPWFLIMKMLGLYNNFLAYILPSIVIPFYVMLFKTYFEQIPSAIEESAQIDGAGYLVRFIYIILPVSLPILATIAVFASVGQWNSFYDTLFLMRSSSLYTLQYQLYQYLTAANALATMMKTSQATQSVSEANKLTPIAVRMTISIVVSLPIIFAYPFLQRYFVKGIMIGAVKG